MRRIWVVGGLALGLIACASGPAITRAFGTNTFEQIRSEDGSLVILPGQEISVPPGVACYADGLMSATNVFGDAADDSRQGLLGITNPSYGPRAVSKGAIPVRVQSDGSEYFGAIMFCKPHRWCPAGRLTGPAATSLAINIPASTYANAKGGKIATAYETATVMGCFDSPLESPTWVMWLSDQKF